MGIITTKIRERSNARAMKNQLATDLWFARLAHISQVLLLGLGVFGYFYTVLPVYEKALLDEEIAEKTLALKKASTELMSKQSAVTELTAEINQKIADLSAKDRLLRDMGSEVQDAKHKQVMAEIKGQSDAILLKREYLSDSIRRIRSCVPYTILGLPKEDNFTSCLNSKAQESKKLLDIVHGSLGNKFVKAVSVVSQKHEPEFKTAHKEFADRINPIQIEANSIDETYKTTANMDYSAPERQAAISNYFKKGAELRKDIRTLLAEFDKKQRLLMDTVAEEVWKAMW